MGDAGPSAGSSGASARLPSVLVVHTIASRGARELGRHLLRLYISAPVLAFLCWASAAFADSPVDLDTVVITATRTAEPVEETLASISLISREDIDRLQPASVQDLLTGITGISVVNSGGLGKLSSVFVRGAGADATLVLIDGLRIGSVSSGTAAFEQLPVDQIDHIEIVRGPRSSLYGSDAIGGVIQIFTRRGEAGPPAPSLSVTGGSYATWQGQAGVSGGSEQAWYSLSVAGQRTGGFQACRGIGAPVYAGCFYDPPPGDDGYWNTSGSVRGGYRFDNGLELSADWLRVYGYNEYAGTFVNRSKVAQQVLGGTIALPSFGVWQSTLSGGQTRDDSNDYLDRVYVDTFDSQRSSASWQNEFRFQERQRVVAGVDWLQDRLFSSTPYPRNSRSDLGEFLQYQGGWGPAEVQVAGRSDHDGQFGQHFTGSAAVGWALGQELRLTLSYGTAFEAPTFNDLYYPVYSNPNLRPVTSRSFEVGMRGRLQGVSWTLSGFQTRIDDLIVYDFNTGIPVNLGRSLIRGLETTLAGSWRGVQSQLNLTFQDPRDRTPGDNDTVLPRRAERMVRWDLDRQFGKAGLGLSWFVSGRRFDDPANTQVLGGYGTLDLRADYLATAHWRLQLKAGNLLNKRYETAEYYNQPGRAFYCTLRYVPSTH